LAKHPGVAGQTSTEPPIFGRNPAETQGSRELRLYPALPGAAGATFDPTGEPELLLAYGLTDMVGRMKTTVEIPDPLAEEAKAVARREKTTLRALIETGLRQVLRDRRRRARFRLRDASFGGRGLQPGFREEDWQRIREAAYEGRGG